MVDFKDMPDAASTQTEIERMAAVLSDWWVETAQDDAKACAPKAVEYGSRDLIDMGRAAANIIGRQMTDVEAAEFGIWWYLQGKVARWTAALREGRQVSDDTLLDATTYLMMARRLRAVGGWPFDYETDEER